MQTPERYGDVAGSSPPLESPFPFSPRSGAQSPLPRSLPDLIDVLACARDSPPQLQQMRTPLSPRPPARLPSAPRKVRGERRRSEESSSSSEDTLWPPPLARERPSRASVVTHGVWHLKSHSMPNLRMPVRPVAAAPASGTSTRVLMLDSAASNSVVASLAIDAFMFAVAWAPFSFYGALLFVVAQRLTFFFVEHHTRHGVLE
jgi:hypothetical protein